MTQVEKLLSERQFTFTKYPSNHHMTQLQAKTPQENLTQILKFVL